MSKLSKAIAVLGVVSALGVSALPLSTYAVKSGYTPASEEATVQVKVSSALSIAIENLEGSAAWDGATLDLGTVAPNGTIESSFNIKVTNNVGTAFLSAVAVEPGTQPNTFKAAADAHMHNDAKNQTIEADADALKNPGETSGWAFKTNFTSSSTVDNDTIQAGDVVKGEWTAMKNTYQTLAKIKQQVNSTATPIEPVTVTFGVHVGANQIPDTYKARVLFTASASLEDLEDYLATE